MQNTINTLATPTPKDKELHRIATTCIIYKLENVKSDKKKSKKIGKTSKNAESVRKVRYTYLVTKRAPHKKVHPNKWTVPGGGLVTDDYANEPQSHGGDAGWYNVISVALAREIKEEVNVKMGNPQYLLDMAFIRPDGIAVLVLSYYAPYKGGEVKLDVDAVEHKWVTLPEAKKLDLIPGIYEEIAMVEKILKKIPKKQ